MKDVETATAMWFIVAILALLALNFITDVLVKIIVGLILLAAVRQIWVLGKKETKSKGKTHASRKK